MQKRSLGQLSLVVLAGLGLNIALSQVSQAREVTIASPRGRMTTQQSVTRDGNTLNVNRSTTRPNGSTDNYSRSTTRDDNGGLSESTTHTYSNQDGTNKYQVTDQRSYSDRTYQDHYTVTRPDGKTSTLTNTHSCNNRQCTTQEQHTYANGKTSTESETHSCSNGQCTTQEQRTFLNGKTSTLTNTTACNNGRCNSQEQYTLPNGQTRTVSSTSDRIGRARWNNTETVTNRDGQQRTYRFIRHRRFFYNSSN